MSHFFTKRMNDLNNLLEQEINSLRQKQASDGELILNLEQITKNLSVLLFVNDENKLENLKQDALLLNNHSNKLLSNASRSFQAISKELDYIIKNYPEKFEKQNSSTSVADLNATIEKMNKATAAVNNQKKNSSFATKAPFFDKNRIEENPEKHQDSDLPNYPKSAK